MLNKINCECSVSTSHRDPDCHLLDLFVRLLTPLEILISLHRAKRARQALQRIAENTPNLSTSRPEQNLYQQLRHLVLGRSPLPVCLPTMDALGGWLGPMNFLQGRIFFFRPIPEPRQAPPKLLPTHDCKSPNPLLNTPTHSRVRRKPAPRRSCSGRFLKRALFVRRASAYPR